MSQEKKEEVNTSLEKLLDLIEERLEQHDSNRVEVIDKLKENCSKKDKEIDDMEAKGVRNLISLMKRMMTSPGSSMSSTLKKTRETMIY